MTTSIILAQILGLYLLLMSAAMLINKSYYQETLITMLQNSGVMFLIAVISLLCGVLLVVFHNIWVPDWRVVITLLAWLGLLKGVVRLFFPNTILKWSHCIQNHGVYYSSLGICAVVGLYLIYKGFFNHDMVQVYLLMKT